MEQILRCLRTVGKTRERPSPLTLKRATGKNSADPTKENHCTITRLTILAFYVQVVLYLTTLVTTCQAGKGKKLALMACIRKLLTILNTMMKSGTGGAGTWVSWLDFSDSC